MPLWSLPTAANKISQYSQKPEKAAPVFPLRHVRGQAGRLRKLFSGIPVCQPVSAPRSRGIRVSLPGPTGSQHRLPDAAGSACSFQQHSQVLRVRDQHHSAAKHHHSSGHPTALQQILGQSDPPALNPEASSSSPAAGPVTRTGPFSSDAGSFRADFLIPLGCLGVHVSERRGLEHQSNCSLGCQPESELKVLPAPCCP